MRYPVLTPTAFCVYCVTVDTVVVRAKFRVCVCVYDVYEDSDFVGFCVPHGYVCAHKWLEHHFRQASATSEFRCTYANAQKWFDHIMLL